MNSRRDAAYMMALAMAMAGAPRPFGTRYPFNSRRARERSFKVHDRDNDRQLRPFKVKGCTIMAYSKKDAIIRWKHQRKGGGE